MFKDDKVEDLTRMYSLFSRVPKTLDEVRKAMGDHIKDRGRELVNDKQQFKASVCVCVCVSHLANVCSWLSGTIDYGSDCCSGGEGGPPREP